MMKHWLTRQALIARSTPQRVPREGVDPLKRVDVDAAAAA
jgi:hypothetical protein